MMAVLLFKMEREKFPPPIRDLNKRNLKIRDMVLIKNHIAQDTFDLKYKLAVKFVRTFGQGF